MKLQKVKENWWRADATYQGRHLTAFATTRAEAWAKLKRHIEEETNGNQ